MHMRGEGPAHCLTCFPIVYPARLVVPRDEITETQIAKIAERVAVVEQLLSASIPEQPFERELITDGQPT